MFNFLRTLHTIFHSGSANFLSPPTVHMGFLSPHPYQYLLFVVFLIIAILPGVRWYLVLIFVSLMISDVEHLFMYLLIIRMSFLEKRLFRLSAHLLIRFSWAEGMLNSMSSLNVSYMNPLSAILLAYIFSHSVHDLFVCWSFPSLCKSFLVWCSPTCLFLFLFPSPERTCPKNINPDQC